MPLTVISVTRAAAAAMFSSPFDQLAVGTAGLPLSGSAGFIDGPTEAPANNVVGILRGTDPKLRNSYVAIGAHHDHVGMGPPVDHDSIRAFNQVVRVRGADDPPPREVTAEQWTRIRAVIDSLHRVHGVRLDSIFNGADDDGSGTVLALEIAEAFAKAQGETEAIAALRLAYGRGEGIVRRAVLLGSPDGSARLDRRAGEHGSDGSRRAGGQSARRA